MHQTAEVVKEEASADVPLEEGVTSFLAFLRRVEQMKTVRRISPLREARVTSSPRRLLSASNRKCFGVKSSSTPSKIAASKPGYKKPFVVITSSSNSSSPAYARKLFLSTAAQQFSGESPEQSVSASSAKQFSAERSLQFDSSPTKETTSATTSPTKLLSSSPARVPHTPQELSMLQYFASHGTNSQEVPFLSSSESSDNDDKKSLIACEVDGCDAKFDSKRLYREHVQSHDRWQNGRFYCEVEGCGKSFCRAYSLKYHRYTHTDDAPFSCTQCSKKFSHLSRLKRHELSHNPDEKQWKCEFPNCGKRFSQKCHLKIHFETHSKKSRKDKP